MIGLPVCLANHPIGYLSRPQYIFTSAWCELHLIWTAWGQSAFMIVLPSTIDHTIGIMDTMNYALDLVTIRLRNRRCWNEHEMNKYQKNTMYTTPGASEIAAKRPLGCTRVVVASKVAVTANVTMPAMKRAPDHVITLVSQDKFRITWDTRAK